MNLEKYNGKKSAGLVAGLIGYAVSFFIYMAVFLLLSIVQGAQPEAMEFVRASGTVAIVGAIVWFPMVVIAGLVSLKSMRAAFWSVIAYTCSVLIVTGTCTGLLMISF